MGLLIEGKEAIENELVDRSKVFKNAKQLDSMNEGMPIAAKSSLGSTSTGS